MPESDATVLESKYRHALDLYRRARLADAEAACRKLSRQHPTHFGALHLIGIIAFQSGRGAEAVEWIGKAVAVRPDSADAHNNLATALRDLGRLDKALAHYDTAIALKPDNAEAHYNRGTVLRGLGRRTDALASYDAAIARKPGFALAHNNRGNVLRDLGHQDDALASYDKAIAAAPDFAEAWFNRATVRVDLGRSEHAIADFDRAIALRPGHADSHYHRGILRRRMGRFDEALADYDQAIAGRPDHAEAHFHRGNVLWDLHRPEAALASYDQAIALRPDHAEALNNRGNVLRELNRFDAALESYDRAIALNPGFAEAHYNRGNVLRAMRQSEAALSAYDQAIASRPDFAEAHNNRGNALRDLERPEAALASYDTAIGLRPDHAEACYSRGAVLWDLGQPEAALAYYDRALAAKPDFVEARYNKGICHLALGDYERGWEGFEWRWKSRFVPRRDDLPGEPWLGQSPIDGKTILVHAEQGFGDSLQLCRYVPLLAERATVILDVPRPLLRLLSGLKGVARTILTGDPLPRFDAWIPMMSLPLAFHTTVATIPASVPYLYAGPERSAAWRARLAGLPGRKVGLVWAGLPFHGQPRAAAMDRRRSITLRQFAPLSAIPGLQLISLQKGEAAVQTTRPPAGMTLHDWTGELDDYADTAALVEALDLVISVDTSVAHLAGALGKPVWVLNRYDQCWRWLLDRTDSPWYPTARLFRQRQPGDWAGVIRDVLDALRAEV